MKTIERNTVLTNTHTHTLISTVLYMVGIKGEIDQLSAETYSKYSTCCAIMLAFLMEALWPL